MSNNYIENAQKDVIISGYIRNGLLLTGNISIENVSEFTQIVLSYINDDFISTQQHKLHNELIHAPAYIPSVVSYKQPQIDLHQQINATKPTNIMVNNTITQQKELPKYEMMVRQNNCNINEYYNNNQQAPTTTFEGKAENSANNIYEINSLLTHINLLGNQLNSLQQKTVYDINTIYKHYNATITKLSQQMSEQITLLSHKLVQNQQYNQQCFIQLQRQINSLAQLPNHSDCKPIHPNKDTTEDEKIKIWLTKTCKLSQYFDLFIENGYDDVDIISDITDSDLIEMGINKIGHRKKIIKYKQEIGSIKANIKIKSSQYSGKLETNETSLIQPIMRSQPPRYQPIRINSSIQRTAPRNQRRRKIIWGRNKSRRHNISNSTKSISEDKYTKNNSNNTNENELNKK